MGFVKTMNPIDLFLNPILKFLADFVENIP